MRRLYWRPAGASWRSLALLALLSLVGLTLVLGAPRRTRKDRYEAKLAAAEHAAKSFRALAEERVRRGHPIDERRDPTRSGLIGEKSTPLTTSAGSLVSKQTSANPNFAAVVVELLGRLGLERGDVVAVGCSGSFPALNVAVLAAVETLGLEPLVITSNASSDWGANLPDFTWLDMERVLVERKLARSRSLAASLGGIEDRALELDAEGRQLLTASIARNGVALLPQTSFEDAVRRRLELYESAANGRRIGAYVNVGGGSVSVGRKRGKLAFRAGINRPGVTAVRVDSVIARFLERGVPVVHLVRVQELASEHGLPTPPTASVELGQGPVFEESEPNRLFAAVVFVILVGAVVFVGRRARSRAHLREAPELP